MADQEHTLRPNDRFRLSIKDATNEIMVEILSGEKLQGKKFKLQVKALEDARSSDGTLLVSVGDTNWVEQDFLDGFDFDPIPRSEIAPFVSLGDEQVVGDN